MDWSRGLFFDYDGQPCSLERWSELVSAPEKIVAQNEIDETFVSTVYLGIDHMAAPRLMHPDWELPPMIYETMIFPAATVWERYPTRAAALAGHDQAVTAVRLLEHRDEGDAEAAAVQESEQDPRKAT